MKYLWCYSVYGIVLLLGKQEQCYHPFAVGALLEMWGFQDTEEVEVSREKSHLLYSQLADMKNEICSGDTDLLCGGYHEHRHIITKCI